MLSNTSLVDDQVRVLAERVATGLDSTALQVALRRFRFIHLHQVETATRRHEHHLHERLAWPEDVNGPLGDALNATKEIVGPRSEWEADFQRWQRRELSARALRLRMGGGC